LRDNNPIVFEDAPDKFSSWFTKVSDDFKKRFKSLENLYLRIYSDICEELQDAPKKEYAERFKNQSNPNILFSMYNGKDHKKAIWDIMKPERESHSKKISVVDEV